MLFRSDACDWVTSVTVRTPSGVETAIFRDGDQTIRTEVERLLGMGTSAGGVLEARILADRSAVIEAQPAAGTADLRMADTGAVRYPLGQALADGELPVGRWVVVDGAPPGLANVARFYVDRAEYQVEERRLNLEPKKP